MKRFVPIKKLEVLGAMLLAGVVLAFDAGATYTAHKARAAEAPVMAVFVLSRADGTPFGSVQNVDPMAKADCEKLVNDPDARMWVAEQVKQQTGEDVIVRGLCHPLQAPSRPA